MKASNLWRLPSPTGWKSRTLTPTPVNCSAPSCNPSTPTANPSGNPSMPSPTAHPDRHPSWCGGPAQSGSESWCRYPACSTTTTPQPNCRPVRMHPRRDAAATHRRRPRLESRRSGAVHPAPHRRRRPAPRHHRTRPLPLRPASRSDHHPRRNLPLPHLHRPRRPLRPRPPRTRTPTVPTSGTNQDPFCRRHHRGKTFAWLACIRDDHGVDWTMPDAEHYRCTDEPLPTGMAAVRSRA